MKALLLIFISVFLSSGPAAAYPVPGSQKVSYKEYLSQVLTYYPSLKKEQASVEKTIAQKALAASSRLPKFWASIQSEYGNDPVYVFGALLRQNKFTSDDLALKRLNSPSSYADNSAGVKAEWLLFDFSQTSDRIKTAGILTESASFQEQFTKMEAIMAASTFLSRTAIPVIYYIANKQK